MGRSVQRLLVGRIDGAPDLLVASDVFTQGAQQALGVLGRGDDAGAHRRPGLETEFLKNARQLVAMAFISLVESELATKSQQALLTWAGQYSCFLLSVSMAPQTCS